MDPTTSGQAAQKNEAKDADLILRMVTVMVTMLTSMKAKVMAEFYKIRIINDPAGKIGQANAKGQRVDIVLHRGLISAFVQFSKEKALQVSAALRPSRRNQPGTTAPAKDEKEVRIDSPFVNFVMKQVNRILQAPRYICTVKNSEYFGQCFYDVLFEDGLVRIQLKPWAYGAKGKDGKWTSKHWTRSPFLKLDESTVNELIKNGHSERTTTKRGETIEGDGKSLKGPAKKYRQAKINRTAYVNAALAMAQLMMYTEDSGFIKESHPIGYYIEASKKPNRHTRVLGFIHGNADGRFRVSGLTTEQHKTVYTIPARHGKDMEIEANSLCYTLKDFVLGKRNKKGSRGAPAIAFGQTSSHRKELETHFQKPVRDLCER